MAMDMKRYENVLRKQTGKVVRPHRFDGFVNAINRYGTSKDDTEQYFYNPEPIVDDSILEMFYENNGLFAKIIDTPAEEAVKHGFTLDGVEDEDLIHFYESALDELDWEETAMTALKWARLFGGSVAVMLINDGHALEEPLEWRKIRSIDDIVVFDRSLINPDRTSMYKYDSDDPFGTRGSRLGTPEWYEINGPCGSFVVHDSRCLVFRNGILPQNAQNENYQIWGIPEYVRISRAVRNAEIAHESAPKMLSKSVQPVYKMKDLAMELASEEGEDRVLRRLQAIDMARGLLNSITIDSEGEDYSFQSFGFNGVSDVIDSSCNWLSALTSIPQTILFGRSPAGMNATGESDFENYYNFVERIQKRMLRSNLRYLLSVIFVAGKHTGEVKKIPDIDVGFNPLWSMSETEEAQLESAKLQNEMTRAGIAGAYIDAGVLDPKEVRVELGKEEDIDVESMLDDMSEEELLETAPQGQQEGMGGSEGGMGGENPMAAMMGEGAPQSPQAPQEAPAVPQNEDEINPYYAVYGNAPETAPEATKLPQDQEEEPDHEDDSQDPGGLVKSWSTPDYQPPFYDPDESGWLVKDTEAIMSYVPDSEADSPEWLDDEIKRRIRSVGVLVVGNHGKILSGIRENGDGENYGLLGGPGGHVEPHESLEDAAIRETYEEFGIVPKDLTFLSLGDYEEESGMIPAIFLCTEWAGTVHPIDGEMKDVRFRTIDDILSHDLFVPFESSLEILEKELTSEDEDGNMAMDGGPGSGNFGHGGRPGKVGGSSDGGDSQDKKQETANKKKEKQERKKQEEHERQVAREYGATGLSHFRRNTDTVTVDAEIQIYEHPDKTRSTYTLLKGEVKVKDVFCGKGDSYGRLFRDAEDIAKTYGGNPDDWGHAKGVAAVRDVDGSVSVREVHWMEHPSLGQHDWKVKSVKGPKKPKKK